MKGRTPPVIIVASSESPDEALVAFIAQELEHWGFSVAHVPQLAASIRVRAAAELGLYVTVRRVTA